MIYITVLGAAPDITLDRALRSLMGSKTGAAPSTTVQWGRDCFFELREKGVHLALHAPQPVAVLVTPSCLVFIIH